MRPTRRQIYAAAAGLAALVAVVAAALNWWPVVVGLLAALQAGVLALLIDLRGRTARATELRRVARQVRRVRDRIDHSTEQMTAAVESALSESEEGVAVLRAGLEELSEDVSRHVGGLNRAETQRTREVEALLQLYSRISPRSGMPSSGGWAIDATGVLTLLDLVASTQPGLVVELGSGTSSVWLGYALEPEARGRVVSIEHDAGYAERTASDLRRHGLDKVVELRNAPLVASPVPWHETPWYDPSVLDDLHDIDLLIVDGPPGGTGPLARYPALPVLQHRLTTEAVVVLDDANRDSEREIVRRWSMEIPGWRAIEQRPGTRLAILSRE